MPDVVDAREAWCALSMIVIVNRCGLCHHASWLRFACLQVEQLQRAYQLYQL